MSAYDRGSRTASWLKDVPLDALGPFDPEQDTVAGASNTPENLPPEHISLPTPSDDSQASDLARNVNGDTAGGASSASASRGSLWQLENATSRQATSGEQAVRTRDTTLVCEGPRVLARSYPNYWARVRPLLACFPHLSILPLDHKSRYPAIGKVVVVDHSSTRPPRTAKSWAFDRFSQGLPQWRARVEEAKTTVPDDVNVRLLLVEDLSDDLIEALGAIFHLDPDIFASHLVNAARKRFDHDEGDASISSPSQAGHKPTTFVSLKWIRAVRQNEKLSEWLEKPETLLNEREVVRKQDGKSTKQRGLSFRDTVSQTLHRITVNTNTFRRWWSLSSAPGSASSGLLWQHSADSSSDRDWRYTAIPTAWQERATITHVVDGPVTFVIMLLDPLPSVTDHARSAAQSNIAGQQRPTVRSAQVPLSCALSPRIDSTRKKNKLDYHTGDIAQLRATIETLTPTLDAVQHWTARSVDRSSDPFHALLRIVQTDTKAFVRALEQALEQIGRDSLDDYLMERRLASWRRLMNDLLMPAVRESLRNLKSYMRRHESPSTEDSVNEVVSELEKACTKLIKRTDKTYAALRIDMQFSESRRSIAEAKTMTKLTELAFVFIPLSFVSSLDSMSVNELQNGVPIWTFVTTAVVFAGIAYGVQFTVANDFLADSSRRALERFWARRNVRRGASVPTLTFIMLTLQETWEHGGKSAAVGSLAFVFLSAFIVVPVGFLLVSTGLETGFKTSVTLLLVLSGLGLALFLWLSKHMGEPLPLPHLSRRWGSNDSLDGSADDVALNESAEEV